MSEEDDHSDAWHAGLTEKDWLLDGYPIKDFGLEMWRDLDWSKAYVDLGPSPAGNTGPYWHVPLKSGDTVHRLYPKVLRTKWAPLIRQAIAEKVAALSTEALQAKNKELFMENFDLRRRMRTHPGASDE